MRTVTARLESISPYSQSRHYASDAPKKDKELHRDYEARTWMHRCHTTEDGSIFIPPMAFKNCVAEAAKFLSVQVPGKGKATWTKHFEAGILVTDGITLPLKRDEVQGEWLFVPSDGKRGGGSRVEKCFPLIPKWSGDVKFYIVDEAITREAFEYHLKEAGNLIGIGRFRPRNNGFYGRFQVTCFDWE